VSAEQARHMNVVCKAYRRGGHIERVDFVNGMGRLTGRDVTFLVSFLGQREGPSESRRACSFHFLRDAEGKISAEHAHDQAGRLVWKMHYTSPTTAQFVDADGFPTARAPSGAAYIRFILSRDGLVEEAWYLDRLGQRQPTRDGVYGERFENDERGLTRRITYLNARGEPTQHRGRGNIAGYTGLREANGAFRELAYFGRDGKPALNNNGVARLAARYDERGNQTEMAHFGLDGKPTLNKGGYSRFTAGYDERGNRIEGAYFGTDGKPAVFKDGFARWTAKYDEHGNRVEEAYFGVDGQPAVHTNGHAKFTARFDERGYRTETISFGADGRAVNRKAGWAKEAVEYGPSGQVLERSFWKVDSAGKFVLWQRKDGAGRLLENVNLKADGRPLVWPEGHHRWVARYDGKGHQIETSYFGLDGKPGRLTLGHAKFVARYDGRGNRIEQSYFGPDGKPCLHRDGNHKFTARYDGRGHRIEMAFFGLDGALTLIREGYARWTAKYDGRGNQTEQSYFGVDGQPLLNSNGFARFTWAYNDRNQLVDVAAFDTRGQPVELEVFLSHVTRGGQADRLGLRVGDVLLRYDGRPVANWARFVHGRRSEAAGGPPRPLEVLRQGKTLTVAVSPGLLGANLNNRTKQREAPNKAP
jgi:hypothetical protein